MSGSDPAQERLLQYETAYQPAFTSGELSPALLFRADLAKQHSGAAVMRNFCVQVQGNVSRRPGTQWAGALPAGGTYWLIPFRFNVTQQYVVVAAAGSFRFAFQGSFLVNPDGSAYTVATPYAAGDLAALRFVQSADVMTVVHPNYAPMELKRLGALSWTLTPMLIGSQLATPAAPTVVPTQCSAGVVFSSSNPAPAQVGFYYAITACSTVTQDESQLSVFVAVSNIDTTYYSQFGTMNTLSWTVVPGADFYKVYRLWEGVWSFIGSTTTLSFADQGISPDTALSPPVGVNPFAGGNWPGVVGYFQERRFFGGSTANPETIWTSRSGNYTSFDVSNPLRDDDGITFTLAARQINTISHFIPLTDMLIFTSGGGWRLNGQNGAVTPSNFDLTPQTVPGCSGVEPIVIGNYVLFVEAKGSSVRELVYNLYANSYVSEDRSVYSNHLFAGHVIVAWAWAESPHKVLWLVREDGVLLSLTYLKEQDIYAWAEHAIRGQCLAVTVVSEPVLSGIEDIAYLVVQDLDGSCGLVRMTSQLLGPSNMDARYAWCVDRGVQVVGGPIGALGGLGHLNGQTVIGLADGVPFSGVVAGGQVALPAPASVVTAGQAFTSVLQTIPLDSPRSPLVGTRKRIARVRIPVVNTAGLVLTVLPGDVPLPFVGQVGDDPNDPSGPVNPNVLVTGVQELVAPEGWDRYGQVTLTASGPQQANISGVAVQYEVGM